MEVDLTSEQSTDREQTATVIETHSSEQTDIAEGQRQQTLEQLNSWQTTQIARHKDRPYAADYIRLMCDDFFELHGDRSFGDDQAIIAGLALLDNMTVMFICQEKGRDTRAKQRHNYGMPHPEGYRKAYRLMVQAEKFHIPLICLVDTPGAFPGLDDERRGQSEAIAANLALMGCLEIPIISVVIGEGGSGGALALSIANRLLMLEHSIYAVASPEAAASILWHNTKFAPDASEAMGISASELQRTLIFDEIVPEPPGGAHRDHTLAASNLKKTLVKHLAQLRHYTPQELIEQRYRKFRNVGPVQYLHS